jgi:alginate O-acetyltransferase complex protein AlgI
VLFNSAEFLVFFAIVFALYYLPIFRKFQTFVLIAASLFFYYQGAHGITILLLVSIIVNALISFSLTTKSSKTQRGTLLFSGIVFNLAILCFFKYAGLLFSTLVAIKPEISTPPTCLVELLSIGLPLGISFYCFEGISLVVDSARVRILRTSSTGDVGALLSDKRSGAREQNGEQHEDQNQHDGLAHLVLKDRLKHLSDTGLFISFFPHLISGPILRAAHFFPQIEPKSFRKIDWNTNFKWLVLGYFLKVFVADNLSEYTLQLTSPTFQTAGKLNNLVLLIAYSAQIFADFAGYSYIALALAGLLGYSIPNNFNAPYLARSLGEFWNRWHISLSLWMRDYLFIPLGGSRCNPIRASFNLMLVMILGGLWHGAHWNFVLWGAIHGFGLMIEHLLAAGIKLTDSFVLSFSKRLLTFWFVTFAWVTFLIRDTDQMLRFIQHLFSDPSLSLDLSRLILLSFYSIPVLLLHLYQWNKEKASKRFAFVDHNFFKASVLALMIFLIFFNPGPHHAFMYFQF